MNDEIKGLDIEDYVYIPKWREQELLSQEEQLEDYKSRIEKAVEYLKNNCYIGDCINTYEAIDITNVMNILNGKGSDE